MSLLAQYQSRVLRPDEVVEYSAAIKHAYPPQAIQLEPFIGLKVLCKDTMAFTIDPASRIRQIEANLAFLRGKGCLIRETTQAMPDGFWVITMPVPRSQLAQQFNNLMDVITVLEQYFSIIRQGLVEINVSGRCTAAETERCMTGLVIPQRYMGALVVPDNTAYRYGHIIRINDNFMCLRTRWNLTNQTQNTVHYEEILVLAQLISSMYH